MCCAKMFRLTLVFLPLFGVLLLGGFLVWAQRPDPPTQPNQESRPIAPSQVQQTLGVKRIREGTTFKNLLVFFRPAGDRTALYIANDNTKRFTCLENLELERILTAIQEKPEREYWRIEGEYTEFRGENYVFIRRAMVASVPTVSVPSAP